MTDGVRFVFSGSIKDQLDRNATGYAEALARARGEPLAPGAYSQDPAAPQTNWNRNYPNPNHPEVAPKEPVKPDPAGSQRRAQNARPTPVRQAIKPQQEKAVRPPSVQAQVMTWLESQDGPRTVREVAKGFPDRSEESVDAALKRLRAVGLAQSRSVVTMGVGGHVGQWMSEGKLWPDVAVTDAPEHGRKSWEKSIQRTVLEWLGWQDGPRTMADVQAAFPGRAKESVTDALRRLRKLGDVQHRAVRVEGMAGLRWEWIAAWRGWPDA